MYHQKNVNVNRAETFNIRKSIENERSIIFGLKRISSGIMYRNNNRVIWFVIF